jgi:hypothetical protein
MGSKLHSTHYAHTQNAEQKGRRVGVASARRRPRSLKPRTAGTITTDHDPYRLPEVDLIDVIQVR